MIIVIVCFVFILSIGFYFFGNKKENKYIKTHKFKWELEKEYDDYIKWLDENGGDLPIKEVKFNDDKEVLKEINKNFNS